MLNYISHSPQRHDRSLTLLQNTYCFGFLVLEIRFLQSAIGPKETEYHTCRLKAEETCSPSHQCPVLQWSSLAMPRCQRFSWPLFGARPDERGGEEKLPTKTQKNESFREQASTNLKDSRSNASLKVVYTFL